MARGELMSEDEADARVESEAAERAAAWAAFGVRIEDEAPAEVKEFHLLTDCEPVFDLWCQVQTQWRSGFEGRTGMDYGAVESYMRMSQNPLRRDRTTIHYLRCMERSALNVYAEARAK